MNLQALAIAVNKINELHPNGCVHYFEDEWNHGITLHVISNNKSYTYDIGLDSYEPDKEHLRTGSIHEWVEEDTEHTNKYDFKY